MLANGDSHPARKAGRGGAAPRTTRTTRHSSGSTDSATGNARGAVASAARRAPLKVLGPLEPSLSQKQTTAGASKVISTSASAPPTQQKQSEVRPPDRPSTHSDRNVDKIVFGDICFRAWYPSYYGKDVLGDISGNSTKGNANAGNANGGSREDGEAKSASRRDRDNPPILDRLYVCPSCFKYSKELVTWWEHVHACELQGSVPGSKIYVHPKGRRTVPAQPFAPTRGPKKRKIEPGAGATEKTVQDEGEWSIWEVDGAEDVVSSLLVGRCIQG